MSGGDTQRLERVALDAVLRATDGNDYNPRALTGIASNLSPREAPSDHPRPTVTALVLDKSNTRHAAF